MNGKKTQAYVAIAGAIVAGIAWLFSGGTPKNTYKGTSPYELKLEAAKEILVQEYTFSAGKDYDIVVGKEKVATVEGKNVRAGFQGDIFTLKTIDDKVLAYEKEHKRWLSLNRAASVYNGNQELVGYLGEEKIKDFFSVSYIFHIYDKNKKEVGTSKKFTNSSLGTHGLYDMKGNKDYDINKHFTITADEYKITVLDNESEIPLYTAILLTCIEDAIGDSN